MELEVFTYLPDKDARESSLLFVHGANHGAWCWKEHFLPYFSSIGFPSYAVSLRGHGGSEGYDNLHSFSLDDYVEDVLQVISGIKGNLILIGHSMGGAVVQKILQHCPENVDRAVLMASISHKGMSRDMLRVAIMDLKAVLRLIKFNKGEKVTFPTRVFFSDKLNSEDRDRYVSMLQIESKKASSDLCSAIVTSPKTTKTPILVLGSKRDWYFPNRTAKGIAKAYGTEAVIFSDISHDMMLDIGWKNVAGKIEEFITGKIAAEKL